MKTYKIEELEGALLDAAVAKAAGVEIEHYPPAAQAWGEYPGVGLIRWLPSTSWELGGAIIERERINLHATHLEDWRAWTDPNEAKSRGDTALIAAMRAFVASKFGETVGL